MDELYHDASPYDQTVNLNKVVGAKVISQRGYVIGRVREVRIHGAGMELEGIGVWRWFKPKIYIGKDYIERLSEDAVLLKVEPSILHRGKVVVTFDGRRLGKVKGVTREQQSNTVHSLTVGRIVGRTFTVPANAVHAYGNQTIILSSDYRRE